MARMEHVEITTAIVATRHVPRSRFTQATSFTLVIIDAFTMMNKSSCTTMMMQRLPLQTTGSMKQLPTLGWRVNATIKVHGTQHIGDSRLTMYF